MFFSRGKNIHNKGLTCVPELYKDYIKDLSPDSPYYVSYKEYRKILEEYLKEVSSLILKGFTFKIPFSLGYIRIIKKATNRLKTKAPIDWYQTNLIGRKVYNFNEHSKGYRYAVLWDRTGCRYIHLIHYAFSFTRGNKRTLAKLIKSKEIDYFEK